MQWRQAFYRDLPGEHQKFDYGVRTDGQPDYVGYAKNDKTTAEACWTVHFFKYDVNGNITDIYSKEGIKWDSRVAEFASYAV